MSVVIGSVSTSMRPIIAGRRQQFSLDLDSNLGTVMGDERQLEHVVMNLLTNASKFTPEGGEISVDARRLGDEVVISVRDSGIGIAADDLPRVFSRFYRGSGRAAEIPGTGLGLAIVQGIVTQHGGSVSIESEVGVGTTVTLVLAAAENSAPSSTKSSGELEMRTS
jgi:signal transduction histidine kinase